MKPHCSAMPWVPGIADFTAIPNMGVVLLSCITGNETTRVCKTGSSIRSRVTSKCQARSNDGSELAAC